MIGDDILDAGLKEVAKLASRVDLCSAEPTTFGQATGTASLGYTGQFTISAPQACSDGRKVVVSKIEDGTITRRGRPTWWAVTGQSKLLATGEIVDGLDVQPGALFRLPPLDIELER
jgi:hypothetical protein